MGIGKKAYHALTRQSLQHSGEAHRITSILVHRLLTLNPGLVAQWELSTHNAIQFTSRSQSSLRLRWLMGQ